MKYLIYFSLILIGCGTAPTGDVSTPINMVQPSSSPSPSPSPVPAAPCTVSQTTSTVTIACPDGSKVSYSVPTLPTNYAPTSVIAPCGVSSSPYKELLLCLVNGDVMGSFSDSASGLNTRLALLSAGSYVDTDDSGCQFTVSIDNSGNTTVSWNQGSNQYSSWVATSVVCKNGS
jgi:hypothetical protein